MFNKADRIIIKKMPQEVIDHINKYWVLDGRQIQDLRPSECMSATQQCYFRLRDQELLVMASALAEEARDHPRHR